MKEGLNYKSKRTIIIVAIIVALLAAAVIGTIAFIKGNQDASATTENSTGEQTVVENNNDDGTNINNEATNQNPTGENAETNNNQENNAGANTAENANGGATTDNGTNNGANGNAATTNNGTNRNVATNNGETGRTATTTNQGNVPTAEYRQTGEEVERKISDSFYASWVPIAVNAITEQISIPEIEAHKMSYINNETENDLNIHSAVIQNDYITYKISVKNNGKDDVNNIHIYDTVPEGTKFIAVYDEGTEKNGRLTWVKDVKAGEEVIVSFRVKVILEKDAEGKEITQIDNTAIVNGNETETTHNPIILPRKEVKTIAQNANGELKELDNQAVVPGSRLRYYVSLSNNSEFDGTTMVTDQIPEGTTLIEGTISEGGEVDENNVITWKNVEVKAGETARVYFDVVVNNNTRTTVKNIAKIGPERPEEPKIPTIPENHENPEEPEKPDDSQYTNEVQTPVIIARKKSKVFDGNSAAEKAKVTYLVEVVATEVDAENAETTKMGTAKLVDKFWNNDEEKVTFISGKIKVEDKDGNEYKELSKEKLEENEINNIEVDLNPGDKASIEYVYELNTLPEGAESQTVKNNLYWAKPGEDDPSRPEIETDTTRYENPNPDEENEFKNEDLKDYEDPTDPEVDENDDDTETKDPTKPIDTVVIEVKPIKAVKKVNPVTESGELLDNQPVIPGSRLRYTITLTNESDVEGVTTVTDLVPEGTELIEDSITDGGVLKANNETNNAKTIVWDNLKVAGRTKNEDGNWVNGTKDISFDVIVNKSTRNTVENVATIGTNPEDPETQKTTNKVQTPVIIARKTSKVYDGKSVAEKTRVTYLVEIVSTKVDEEFKDSVKEKKIRLVDQFWIGDEEKVTYVEGSLSTSDNVTRKESETETIKNIEVTLKDDDKATLEYSFEVNKVSENAEYQFVKNNLYWALPSEDEPERPESNTNYENPNPDTENEFKNEDLKDYEDPTAPEVDPNDQDTTNKDTENPIDTVVVKVSPITGEKRVNPLAYNAKTEEYVELDNQAVIPGSRLRYTITLTNETDYEGTTNISDVIPEGTTLIEGTISDRGTNSNGTIVWNNIKVQAKSTKDVSFEVVVNNNTRTTVKNTAKIGSDPDPDKQKPTNEVQTPVVIARKTSKVYDGKSVTEKTKITYLVEVVSTKVDDEFKDSVKEQKIRLVDQFWIDDEEKVTFVNGSLRTSNNVTRKESEIETIKNIEVTLKDDDKATLEYSYEMNKLPAGAKSEVVKNNLYWALPEVDEPQRPEIDTPRYENPNPDTNNEFKNEELVNYTDPTAPEVDERDQDTTNKDPQKPIDTVVVEVFSITARKKVNAVTADGKLLDNQPVVPGSKLKYTIELINDSNFEGTINVSDVIPQGTKLVEGSISDRGTNSNGTIVWNNIKVPAKTTKPVSFEVTVNNNTRFTVKNKAKTGTETDPSKQTPTNEVQTPVIIARKTSKVSDGKTLNGNNVNEVTYLVEIVATEVDNNNTAKLTEATVKLIDKFWNDDVTKVEYKAGSLQTTGTVIRKPSDEETIKNIEAKIAAGGKVTLEYTYKLKQIGATVNKDTIENNLYWRKPEANDPARPGNGDTTKYSNPNPDSNNQFKNDDLKNYTDPTNPEKDPSDNDNSDKDASNPIDTVKVTLIKYGLVVNKQWIDSGHTDQRPAGGITVSVYGRDKTKPVATKTGIKGTGDNWEIKFDNLPLADSQGTINYTVKEEAINNYETTYNGLTIKNTFRQDIEGVITIKNTKTSNVPVDVVFVLDISTSMLIGTTDADLRAWESGITPPNRYSRNNRATDMVASVNSAIKNIMDGNPNNRVGIVLFNRQGYEMLQLGRYTAKSGNQYIKFANNSNGTVDANPNNESKSAYIVANVNQTPTKQYVQFRDTNAWSVNKKIGTNTQAGIISGYNLFKNVASTVTNNNGAGKGVKHTPVMILLTDGDPTHIYTKSSTDPRKVTNYNNVQYVANQDINPNANPNFPFWTNTVTGETDQCYGLVDKTEAIYYSKTMDTINYAKSQVTSRYSKAGDGDAKTCKLYTIGMYMKGAMAEALLNPTKTNINNLNTKLNDISSEITNSAGATQLTKYKDASGNVLTGKAYYNKQQKDLYNQLGTNFNNYANGSYNGKMTQAQMNAAFTEIVQENAHEDIKITIENSHNREKIELKNLDTAKAFSLKVKIPKDTGTTVTYDTLAKAQNSGYIVLENNKYYLDLSKIPTGTSAKIDIEYYSK